MKKIMLNENLSLVDLADRTNRSFALAGSSFRAIANSNEVGIYLEEKKLYNFLPAIEEEHITIDFEEKSFSLQVRLYFITDCSESFRLSPSELSCQDILYRKLGHSAGMIISNSGEYYFREIINAIALAEKRITREYNYTGFNQNNSEYVIDRERVISASTPAPDNKSLNDSLDFIITNYFNLIPTVKALILFCIMILSCTKSIFHLLYNFSQNFLTFIFSPTGSYKSSIARVLFCPFSPEKADISFESTLASFDSVLKHKRDLTCVFDDFRQRPTKSENAESLKKLELLLRSVSDIGGGRTKCIGNKATNIICESTPIVTGEVISSELRSSSARIFALEIEKHEVNLENLTAIQENAHHLQTFLTAYIQYVINNPTFIDASARFYKKTLKQIREDVKDIHGRHNEMVAWIQTGFFMLLYFISNSGHFSNTFETTIRMHWNTFSMYLNQYLITQSALTGSYGRLRGIMKVLSILLDDGKVILPNSIISSGSKTRHINASPTTIGFYENDIAYLRTDRVAAIVSDYYIKNGKSDYDFSGKEFRRLLKESNIIDIHGLKSGALTKLVSVNNRREYFTPVKKEAFTKLLKGDEDNE